MSRLTIAWIVYAGRPPRVAFRVTITGLSPAVASELKRVLMPAESVVMLAEEILGPRLMLRAAAAGGGRNQRPWLLLVALAVRSVTVGQQKSGSCWVVARPDWVVVVRWMVVWRHVGDAVDVEVCVSVVSVL